MCTVCAVQTWVSAFIYLSIYLRSLSVYPYHSLWLCLLSPHLLPQVPRALRLLIAWQCLMPYARTSYHRCLVHCAAGINRSGFVAGAELLLHTRLSLLEVVARLRAARGVGLHFTMGPLN